MSPPHSGDLFETIPSSDVVPNPNVLPLPKPRHTFLQAFQSFLYIFIVAIFFITFTVQPFRIPSESMEPTLLVGDFLLVDKQVGPEDPPHLFAPAGLIRRGDIIVFHYPIDPTLQFVKRVAGLPGDHLRLHEGRVFLNNHPIPDPFATFHPSMPDAYRDEFPRTSVADPNIDSRWWIQMQTLVAHGELTVPPGNYFVLGDNRNDSEDSRYWGFVPKANIIGKPFLIYFSINTPADSPDNTPGSLVRWNRVLRIIR